MKKLLVLAVFVIYLSGGLFSCTSAVISGKATSDGRPLLWKHRDSDFMENKLMYFTGNKYNYTGMINSEDAEGNEIWMGSNSAGFSIMNTASYNLNVGEISSVPDDQEGLLIKQALATCATVSDFENLLKEGKGKWGVAANFGVIDAEGGAAYFETGYTSYVKYDVNDTKTAPDGYLIRTNFSFSGDTINGKGYIRFYSAESLFKEYFASEKKFTVDFILQTADKYMTNFMTKKNLYNEKLPADEQDTTFVAFRDFTVRTSTVSSMLVQGVKEGEDPRLTTIWARTGFPLTALITPVWVGAGAGLPAVTIGAGKETALVNKNALKLKKKCFPLELDNLSDYINLAAVINQKGTGVVQILTPKDEEIIRKTSELILFFREKGFDSSKAGEFYSWLDKYISEAYNDKTKS